MTRVKTAISYLGWSPFSQCSLPIYDVLPVFPMFALEASLPFTIFTLRHIPTKWRSLNENPLFFSIVYYFQPLYLPLFSTTNLSKIKNEKISYLLKKYFLRKKNGSKFSVLHFYLNFLKNCIFLVVGKYNFSCVEIVWLNIWIRKWEFQFFSLNLNRKLFFCPEINILGKWIFFLEKKIVEIFAKFVKLLLKRFFHVLSNI